MEDNVIGEFFQNIDLDEIKEKSKQREDTINELIAIKEWCIIDI